MIFTPKRSLSICSDCTGQEAGWQQAVDSAELRPILSDDLVQALAGAGFDDTSLHGGYDRSPFRPEQSGDLIAVATR